MKKYALLIMTMLLVGLLAGCGGQQEAKKDLQPLTIGLMPDTDSLPFIIAQENGYFKGEGLEVNI